MSLAGMQRRLAAILVADVVGYTRLMEADETGVLQKLKAFREEVFDPKINEHGGRVFKMTGDGALVEFGSAIEAVRSAIDIQRAANNWNTQRVANDPIELRIGIALGDVIVEGGDLYGNGVNIASRIEALSEPGGICVSGNVEEHIRNLDELQTLDLGACKVKNVSDPVRIYQVRAAEGQTAPGVASPWDDQAIGFCESSDGTRIAYATVGQGPPIVFVANWLTHLELDWKLPNRRATISALSKNHTVVRYDARGSGISDLEVGDISFEASVDDLTAVIEKLDLRQVALIGLSQGAAVASAFAARYPDTVTRLVLYGGYARGRRMRGSEGQIAESDAFITMIRQGWGQKIDAYVRMFGSFFMPDADAKQMASFTKFQRLATPPENAARIQYAIDCIDITDELSRIKAPTLVLHVRDDARAPFQEGRMLAAGIPNSRFIPLEGRNHSMMVSEPAFPIFLAEVERFLRS
jgi:class 3 adenylate cyclase/pimeloyl-ACP methyl ester carboxylesterase